LLVVVDTASSSLLLVEEKRELFEDVSICVARILAYKMDYLPGISLFGRLSFWLAGGGGYSVLLLALSGGEKGTLS
jgi:hypothetical protein